MAARLEGGCGPYRPARVDALPDGPRLITHPIWRHVRCTCLGNATPDCGAPDLPRSLFPALPEMPPGSARPVFYLYGPLCAYPPRFSVTLRLLRDATLLTPPRKTPCACGATAFSSATHASALPVTLRVGRMAGSLSGHSAKNAAGLRPACFFASMSS